MDNLTVELFVDPTVEPTIGMNATIQEQFEFLSVLCGQPFWDPARAWNTDDPDLGGCIENTILVWVPCLFLWISAVLQFIFIWKKTYDPIPWTALTFIRVMISGLLVVSAGFEFVWILIKRYNSLPNEIMESDIIAAVVLLSSYSLQLAMVLCLRRKGIRSSGVLWIFNLLMLLFGIPKIKTVFSETVNRKYELSALASTIYIIQYFSCIVLLIAQSVHDSPSKSQRYHKGKNPSPEEWASLLSLITFLWSFPIMWGGFRRPLKQEDLYDLPQKHSASVLASELKNVTKGYESKKNKGKTSLIWILFRIFRKELMFTGLLYLCCQTISFFAPEILSWLIEFTGNPNEPIWRGLFYAFLLFAAQECHTLFRNFYFYNIMLTTIRCRSVLMQNIYRKSLQLSAAGRRQATLGEIVNLMAVDTYRISDCFMNLFSAIGAPFIIITSLILLWERLGASVLAGLLALLLQVPVNIYISNKVKVLQTKQMKQKDSRLKLISEIINGIKVLKMYAWEESFAKQVEDIRANEISILRKIAILNCHSAFFFNVTPTLVALVSFATYLFVSDSNELNAEKAFVSLALFNLMRFPLMAFPNLISNAIQAKVALTRMEKYLSAPEIDRSAIMTNPKEKAAVVVDGGHFTWGGEDDVDTKDDKGGFQLKNIDLKVDTGSLVAVVGTVGAGKSSLISALLGEMEKQKGHVIVNGSVAYVSQVAWLQNATLQENITWGKPFHSQRYKSVINACALQPDLDMLPGGDQTEIGEKGINLSGGQKQRLSMARAVYSDADVFLMDDPLSAVDAHVGKHMFNHVIGPKGLLRNKTRVLVTHAVSILPQVDEVIVVKDGQIQEKGTYAQLINGGGEVAQFFQQHKTQDIESDDSEEEEAYDFVDDTTDYQSEAMKVRNSLRRLSRRMSSEGSEGKNRLCRKGSFMDSSESFTSKPIDCAHEEAVGQTLIEEEKSETGVVSGKVYLVYWRAMGLIFFIMPVIFLASAQASLAGSNLWLSYCSNKAADGVNSTGTFDRNAFLIGYGGFGFLQAITLLAGVLMVMLGCVKAALQLHQQLLDNVMRLPMSFFDTNPSGRVMNRFSKEIDVLDNTIPGNFRVAITYTMQVIFTIIIIMISTPEAGYAVLPIMILYILIQRMYVATVRQLKRIESVGKSPIYSHFSETIQGLSVIRAFGKGRVFRTESMRKVDHYLTAAYNTIAVNRWLGVTLETMGNIITFSAALLAVLSRGFISPGNVGLTISYAINVTLQLNWVVRVLSDVEANIVSVERIKEYVETKREAVWRLSGNSGTSLLKAWPQEGAIDFQNYQMRYRPGLELVLKGISFNVKSAEKIGIVGRTGAGKSSLTSSLFRLVEAAGGSILIDGKDVSKMGLHDLREKLSIIPQDPVLFSGPLRINLDPFNIHDDEPVWRSLEHANLHTFVRNQPLGLKHNIEEGGANLSVGQRQLMCLARALLRQSRVLVLDEATAAVDLDTDDLIQETIRREFKHCTVLTIAHRLKTILDYDRVLVLDKGLIAEFDSPSFLLADKNSIFHGMAKDAGLVSSE